MVGVGEYKVGNEELIVRMVGWRLGVGENEFKIEEGSSFVSSVELNGWDKADVGDCDAWINCSLYL